VIEVVVEAETGRRIPRRPAMIKNLICQVVAAKEITTFQARYYMESRRKLDRDERGRAGFLPARHTFQCRI
jgi:hypothetical protein